MNNQSVNDDYYHDGGQSHNNSGLNLKVLCTDENDREEHKDNKNFVNGSDDTPLITTSKRKNATKQIKGSGSPVSFL